MSRGVDCLFLSVGFLSLIVLTINVTVNLIIPIIGVVP